MDYIKCAIIGDGWMVKFESFDSVRENWVSLRRLGPAAAAALPAHAMAAMPCIP